MRKRETVAVRENPNAAGGNERLICTIPKNSREEWRFGLTTFIGHRLFTVRACVTEKGTPTKNGLSWRQEEIGAFIGALEKVRAAIDAEARRSESSPTGASPAGPDASAGEGESRGDLLGRLARESIARNNEIWENLNRCPKCGKVNSGRCESCLGFKWFCQHRRSDGSRPLMYTGIKPIGGKSHGGHFFQFCSCGYLELMPSKP